MKTIQSSPAWISRKDAKDIASTIRIAAEKLENQVYIFLVEGGPGSGKTVAARLIGQEFNSSDGYDIGKESKILWTGLLDLFDPDTNSNVGLEQRIQNAFVQQDIYFTLYEQEREFYNSYFKTGIRGSGLEKQRQRIEEAFADDLAEASNKYFPVIALDTVEKLASAIDPIQRELRLSEDTASVIGWLLYQIEKLPRGSILLFGRPTKVINQVLDERFKDNPKVKFFRISLDAFSDQDVSAFFDQRQKEFQELKPILNAQTKKKIADNTKKNPLLMDIALQALLESKNPIETLKSLDSVDDIEPLQIDLLRTYYESLSGLYRHLIFQYLAIARNGLFEDLLIHLTTGDQQDVNGLIQELGNMANLPFVKVRDVYISISGEQGRKRRKTYFLHDEMYLLFDKTIKNTTFVQESSQRIVDWYDAQIQKISREGKLHLTDPSFLSAKYDLIVESFIYRLRADCDTGYKWFLLQEDQALRNILSIGLDMRLRDSLSQFMVLAGVEQSEEGLNLASPIDTDILNKNCSSILDHYPIDMSMLWVKRLSARGNLKKAIEVGDRLVKKAVDEFPDTDSLAWAEFRLWYGQVLMYAGETDKSMVNYDACLRILNVSPENISFTDSETLETIIRVGLIAGRANNNIGYLCWVNEGKYRLSAYHLQQAVAWFKAAQEHMNEENEFASLLEEEIANSQDNLGRVFALLGYYSLAEDGIREGLLTRKRLGFLYREALSLVSLATVQNISGQLRKAQSTAIEAVQVFRKTESEARPSRGIGISLIIKGSIARNFADQWKEENLNLNDALDYVENAVTDLNTAIRIFRDSVEEPVRLVDAYNELACCKRTEYFLRSQDPFTTPKKLDELVREGVANFRRAIDIAKSINHIVDVVDSIQDLSVLYFRAEKFAEAEQCMKEIEEITPNKYEIQEQVGLVEIEKEDAIDALYKTLGQIEMLRGAIIFENGIAMAKVQNPNTVMPLDYETFRETVRHYIFASEYFTHYSTEAYSIQRTHGRMKLRLKYCRRDWIQKLATEFIPELEKLYNLKHEHVKKLLANVFGIIE